MSDANVRGKAELLEALRPVLDFLRTADWASDTLQADLGQRFDLAGTGMTHVRGLVGRGLQEGWLTPKENAGVRFGRLLKPAESDHHMSIDAVDMDAPGPGHRHPKGEVDLCFALEGDPRFDARPEGWTVKSPMSWHIPTVTGGRMAILYFLPEGAIEFGPSTP